VSDPQDPQDGPIVPDASGNARDDREAARAALVALWGDPPMLGAAWTPPPAEWMARLVAELDAGVAEGGGIERAVGSRPPDLKNEAPDGCA
jgi:hypothetical protein